MIRAEPPAATTSALRETARLISRVESGDAAVAPLLAALYRQAGRARIVGISGPPGAGKSTLVDQLIAHYRQQGLTVAVVAVDPSSPFSGGAVLGDRVRMARHATDPGVFIRSLAARGALGGLTGATSDVLTILDAGGWDVILLETVGVGQNEVEVMRAVPAVVIVQNPGDGDAVQSVKAGTLEIAHIFVVNKADMAGATKVAGNLREMLAHKMRHLSEGWDEPVLLTKADKGEGIAELADAIDARFRFLEAHPDVARHEEASRLKARVIDIAAQVVRHRIGALDMAGHGGDALDGLLDRRTDPHEAAERLLASLVWDSAGRDEQAVARAHG